MQKQHHYESPAQNTKLNSPIIKRYFSAEYPHLSGSEKHMSDSNFESGQYSKFLGNLSADNKQNDKHVTDRFIPLRKNIDVQVSSFSLFQQESEIIERGQEMKDDKTTIQQMYKHLFLDKSNSKILTFGESNQNQQNIKRSSYTIKSKDHRIIKEEQLMSSAKLSQKLETNQYRKVNKIPFKILDAPNLQDDFYLNLLEWSSQNILSVALDSSLYFWNANNNRVSKFCQLSPDSISSINWNKQGSQMAIGTSRGTIEMWDVIKNCKLNEYEGHQSRVSSVAWADNLIASGSRDKLILKRDIRERSNIICSKYQGHTQQVCGLKWSFDGSRLASGGNDNKLFIWSPHSQMPVGRFSNHCAAVKGIAWSPHNYGVLASGGGSADKTIKFWNTHQNTLIDSIDTGSQVCNLIFSKNTKQIVSTHGYSNNEIIVWKYPTLQKLTTLSGHTSRVLFLAMNPSGETIVTGAGDQTLRFWNVFPNKSKSQMKSNVLSSMELR